ncbi:hypothetical protein CLOSTASPAR_05848 [[Clostridium] asparagiforme DSM 15981]|uniref:Uncharacterized protein n=1 Tax=[Clostridium] asparagiforme DSM 15981 TaxID=518636 RepID=C0D998_9FIRM|nr:hypothetical protein CLOSTASPAR_05848 [[Clostridium] asparagiforme DSM 15981]
MTVPSAVSRDEYSAGGRQTQELRTLARCCCGNKRRVDKWMRE